MTEHGKKGMTWAHAVRAIPPRFNHARLSRAGQRSGKMQEQLVSLTSRCEELEAETRRLRLKLDAARHDYSHELQVIYLAEERDEARQWANRRTATANERGAQHAEARNKALDEMRDYVARNENECRLSRYEADEIRELIAETRALKS